jgi:hypothetical protein
VRTPTPQQHLAFRSPIDASAPPVPKRQFTDARGNLWEVRERPAPREPWARGASFLLFESSGIVRRVWDFPSDWLTLKDAELEQLSAGQ